MALAVGRPALAQPPLPEDRFTFHVYVDPIYGDDELAYRLNPGPRGSAPFERAFLADYPLDSPANPVKFPDINYPAEEGFLQHAPYSFRTLTGGGVPAPNNRGALAYLQMLLPTSTVTQDWENSRTSKRIHWVVIHCLPGLYGPDSTIDPTLSDYDDFGPVGDLSSTLRYNGEKFPAVLRDGVSIQGTSALDTIFDARGTQTSIIRMWDWDSFTDRGIKFGDIFVDSITVRCAKSNGVVQDPTATWNDSGAGFSIGWDFNAPSEVTISNCFIVENDVGIAMVNRVPDTLEPTAEISFLRPVIVNNTIAWNRIGIYSGNTLSTLPISFIGAAQPKILNNIIDPGHPTLGMQTTCLGLHPWDLRDLTFGGAPGFESFNAWPAGTLNVGAGLANFPAANAGIRPPAVGSVGPPGTAPTTYPAPRVDLSPYMPSATKPRGILYINDAFLASGQSADYSRHDFRLTPHTASDPRDITGSTPISELNPLVNMGVAVGTKAASAAMRSTITFANHRSFWDLRFPPVVPSEPENNTISVHPGLSFEEGVLEPDSFHAWDWDCEGFGNPRIRCRAGFLSWDQSNSQAVDEIDLGADEMDELIIAGYVANTRMFARLVGPSGPVDHTLLHFFDLRTGNHPRPLINVHVGFGYNWWEHTWYPNQPSTNCLDCATIQPTWPSAPASYDSNFTSVPLLPGSYRSIAMLPPPPTPPPTLLPTPPSYLSEGQPVMMRNLMCDFSPTLMGDPHPLWGIVWFAGFFGGTADIYAANPWFGGRVAVSLDADSGAQNLIPVDNWTVYRNPDHPTYPGGVVDGTINPPGTWKTSVPYAECGSLAPSGYFASAPGPALTFCASPTPSSYSIGMWGYGDANCANESFPQFFDWLGVRFNCQVFENGETVPRSNLQTLLLVVGSTPLSSPIATSGPSAAQSGVPSTSSARGTQTSTPWPDFTGPTMTPEQAIGPARTQEEYRQDFWRMRQW